MVAAVVTTRLAAQRLAPRVVLRTACGASRAWIATATQSSDAPATTEVGTATAKLPPVNILREMRTKNRKRAGEPTEQVLSDADRKDIARTVLLARIEKRETERKQVIRTSLSQKGYEISQDAEAVSIVDLLYPKDAAKSPSSTDVVDDDDSATASHQPTDMSPTSTEAKNAVSTSESNANIEPAAKTDNRLQATELEKRNESRTVRSGNYPTMDELPWFVTDNIRGAVKRVWPVAQIIKGLPLPEAVRQMKLCLRRPAETILTTLERTQEYIREKHGIERPEDYIVKVVAVNKGPSEKYLTYHSRGRIGRAQHRNSYVRIKIEPRRNVLYGVDDTPQGDEDVRFVDALVAVKARPKRLPQQRRWNDVHGWKYIYSPQWAPPNITK